MNNDLYHHGVKGQRWGVRRTPEQLGYKTNSGGKKSGSKKTSKKTASTTKSTVDYIKTKVKAAKTSLQKVMGTKVSTASKKPVKEEPKPSSDYVKARKNVKQMSDAELYSAIKRLEGEEKIKELMNPDGNSNQNRQSAPNNQQNQQKPQNGKNKSKEDGLIKTLWNKSVKPGLAEGSKELLKDFIIKKGSELMKASPTELELLAKKSKLLETKATIEKNLTSIEKNKADRWKYKAQERENRDSFLGIKKDDDSSDSSSDSSSSSSSSSSSRTYKFRRTADIPVKEYSKSETVTPVRNMFNQLTERAGVDNTNVIYGEWEEAD